MTTSLFLSILLPGLLTGCTEDVSITAVDGSGGPSLSEAELQLVSGNGQQTEVGAFLPEPLVVQVHDGTGAPFAGVLVEWSFADGAGTREGTFAAPVSTVQTVTDSEGRAEVAWQLGTTSGMQTASASLPVAAAVASLTGGPSRAPGDALNWQANGLPASPDSVALSSSDTDLAMGDSLVLVAEVRDMHGNVIQGEAVAWSSNDESVATATTQGTVHAVGAGQAAVSATAGNASGGLVVTVTDPTAPPPALAVTTPSPLIGGRVGDPYSELLQAVGGGSGYSWSIVAGALPAGLSLAPSTGIISGSLSTTGTASFTAQVSSGLEIATRAYTLTVSQQYTGEGPVFEFSAEDYAETQELRAPGLTGEIDNYYISRGTDGFIQLLTGQTGVPGGGSKVVELTYYDLSGSDQCSQHEPTIALYVDAQELDDLRPREIWWEWDVRFSSDFETQFNCGGFAEHKLMLAQTSNGSGGEARRWDFLNGSGGDHFRMYPSGDTGRDSRLRDPATQAVLNSDDYWDGQWHTYRGHYRMGSANDGAIEAWIDDEKVMEDLNFTTLDASTDYFGPIFKLGANMNLRPNHEQKWYIAGFRVWVVDPGWEN